MEQALLNVFSFLPDRALCAASTVSCPPIPFHGHLLPPPDLGLCGLPPPSLQACRLWRDIASWPGLWSALCDQNRFNRDEILSFQRFASLDVKVRCPPPSVSSLFSLDLMSLGSVSLADALCLAELLRVEDS